SFDVRKKLSDARKEVNPNTYAKDDPRRPEQPQVADWEAIERIGLDTLARTSKDLVVAARLTEALVKRHGFDGLRDGLRLMRRLTQEGWDRVYPVIQDGDLEPRAAAFEWLDDDTFGARFPNTLRTVPLTKVGEDQWYGWQHWKDAQDARGPVTKDAFDKAVGATPREYCQTAVEDIAESAEELNQRGNVLTARMGNSAPGLAALRKALLDCQELATHILQRKGPAPVPAQEAAAGPAASGGAAEP